MIIKQNTKNAISTSQIAYEVFKNVFKMLPEEDTHKEIIYVMGLDNQNKILYVDLVTMGSVNFAHPIIRECLRLAIVKNATSIIIAHNHPSGNTTPSNQDKTFINELKKGGEILNISLLDSIILGKNDFFSFADSGVL